MTESNKRTLDAWMKQHLSVSDFEELAIRGHHLLNLRQKTWYNYRHAITRRIPADVAARLNKELSIRNYQPYDF